MTACAQGIIAKRRDAPYTPGKRTDAWLKHPLIQTQEVLVCGWRPGQRSFAGTLGSLLLGAHDPSTGELIYIGDVGTGFSHADRDALHARLQTLARRTHPFAITPPREDTRTARRAANCTSCWTTTTPTSTPTSTPGWPGTRGSHCTSRPPRAPG
ncbi:ATP-dependent DNA ligase [Amycolatopsis magusensis]|uniref:DNA ligase (ATP) n=1 Tax=Amycolatopsis magusensis TaxID=882444 RepID=A0ABS4PY22_9PSEU|nr:ATP-dependent DNA ligase [Amycolatopsis magusensis]